MRRLISALLLGTALSASSPARADTDLAFSLSIGEREGFSLGLSNYYGVPRDRVSLLVRRGLSYDEVTVALYIADMARVDPFEVADLRMSGMPWIEVSHYYGLGADVYYVDEQPYGSYVSYYEPYRRYARSSWGSIVLSDVAIINLANLRFACQYYGVSGRHVMDWRGRGHNFQYINRQLWRERGRMPRHPVARHRVRPQAIPGALRAKARDRRESFGNRRERAIQSDRRARPRSADVPRSKAQRVDRREENRKIERRDARKVEERRQVRQKAERTTNRREARKVEERRQVRQKADRSTNRREARKAEPRRQVRRESAPQRNTRSQRASKSQERASTRPAKQERAKKNVRAKAKEAKPAQQKAEGRRNRKND